MPHGVTTERPVHLDLWALHQAVQTGRSCWLGLIEVANFSVHSKHHTLFTRAAADGEPERKSRGSSAELDTHAKGHRVCVHSSHYKPHPYSLASIAAASKQYSVVLVIEE